MVQEKLGSLLSKSAAFEPMKKDKNMMASATPKQSSPSKTTSVAGKYGAWGPVFKNKQNFVDMHFS